MAKKNRMTNISTQVKFYEKTEGLFFCWKIGVSFVRRMPLYVQLRRGV
jgi:hypothetical protein